MAFFPDEESSNSALATVPVYLSPFFCLKISVAFCLKISVAIDANGDWLYQPIGVILTFGFASSHCLGSPELPAIRRLCQSCF